MMIDPDRKQRVSDAFFVQGTQFYAAARHAAEHFLMPLCGILSHHAIERLLKACLAQNQDISQLKKMGHNLDKLWIAFCNNKHDQSLRNLDIHIHRLNLFEKLRYPESIVDEGFQFSLSSGGPGPSLGNHFPTTSPKYELNIEVLDRLVWTIFNKCEVDPAAYFDGLPEEYKKFIPNDLCNNY